MFICLHVNITHFREMLITFLFQKPLERAAHFQRSYYRKSLIDDKQWLCYVNFFVFFAKKIHKNYISWWYRDFHRFIFLPVVFSNQQHFFSSKPFLKHKFKKREITQKDFSFLLLWSKWRETTMFSFLFLF